METLETFLETLETKRICLTGDICGVTPSGRTPNVSRQSWRHFLFGALHPLLAPVGPHSPRAHVPNHT